MKTIYLGNLAFEATEASIGDLFSPYGEVLNISLITDDATGKHRGFGFVQMEDTVALAAIEALDGIDFLGRMLRVNEARDRGAKPPRRAY